MPGIDRSGPMGMGAMTGRGLGFCSGNDRVPEDRGSRRGIFGMGSGRGRGRAGAGGRFRGRFRFPFVAGFSRIGGWGAPYGDPDPAMEKQALEQEVKALQNQLKVVQDRLAVMEKSDVSI